MAETTSSGLDILTRIITTETRGDGDILNLTPKVQKILQATGFQEGNVTISVIGSTAAVSTIEYEPGLVEDIRRIYDRIASAQESYSHNELNGDDNGYSHCRATLQGPSLVVPFAEGQLLLGTWQQIVFCDFDTRPRSRRIVVQLIGK